jgi:hypothetical protein
MYGRPTSGKSMCALTASKDWPKNAWSRTKKSKWVELTDVIVIGFDRAAVIGLLPHRIRVRHVFNFPAMVRELGFLRALETLSNEVHMLLEADPTIRIVIHDTITSMDKFSMAYWRQNCPVSDRTGKLDTQGMYGMHLETHRQYQTEMAALPEGVTGIFLFHERVIAEDRGPTNRNKQAEKTTKQLGDPSVNVTPYVTGNGLQFYTNDASLELFISVTKTPGKGGAKKRQLQPATYDGRRVKNRFEHLFTEPIDADLAKVLSMVRDACK